MSSVAHSLRRIVTAGAPRPPWRRPSTSPSPLTRRPRAAAPVDIAPNDPIIPYFQSAAGAVDLEALELDSPALERMRAPASSWSCRS